MFAVSAEICKWNNQTAAAEAGIFRVLLPLNSVVDFSPSAKHPGLFLLGPSLSHRPRCFLSLDGTLSRAKGRLYKNCFFAGWLVVPGLLRWSWSVMSVESLCKLDWAQHRDRNFTASRKRIWSLIHQMVEVLCRGTNAKNYLVLAGKIKILLSIKTYWSKERFHECPEGRKR